MGSILQRVAYMAYNVMYTFMFVESEQILHGPSSKFDQELTPKTKHKGDAESENATVYVCRYASDNIRHTKNIM